jgi:hypothetical protein
MAESWRAKANRYARGEFTNAELKVLLGGMVVDQVIDVATYGRLSQLKAKAFRAAVVPIIRRGAPIAGRALMRTPIAAAGSVRMLAMRHPILTGAAVLYVGYTERERIKELLDQGYDIIEERLPTPSLPPSPGRPGIPGVEEIITGVPRPVTEFFTPRLPGIFKRRRKLSGFNRAVSAGMKAIKKSTSYGKKGTIKPAKKAFTLVTKLAAAKKKKKKAPKSGIRRRVWNAMKGLR